MSLTPRRFQTASMWCSYAGSVDPLEAHRLPLRADALGCADAVHVVDDRAAAERRAGEDRDRAVLGGGEATAEVELEHPGQLELLEVGLVAVLAHLEHDDRAPGPLELGREHAAAGPGADDAHVGLQRGGLAGECSTAIVFGACSSVGGADSGPGIAERVPVGVVPGLVGEAVEEQEGQRAQLADAELCFGARGGDALQQRGARLERQPGDVLRGERVEQLAERLDFIGQGGLREQPLDLGGDAHVRRGARIELAHDLALVVGLERRRKRVARRLQSTPARVAQNPHGHSHPAPPRSGTRTIPHL